MNRALMICAGWVVWAGCVWAAEEPPTKTIPHEVSFGSPVAYSEYKPDEDKPVIVELQTALRERVWEFKIGTPGNPFSRIVSCRRHAGALWKITDEQVRLVVAKSPTIRKGEGTHVVVVGRFVRKSQPVQPPPKPPPEGGGGGVPPPPLPIWKSIVRERGIHLMVINQHNNAGDRTHDAANLRIAHNLQFLLCGRALAQAYPGRVVTVRCGLQGADIPRIEEVDDYLGGLDPKVERDSVATFDTLGHGGHITVTAEFVPPVMRCGRKKEDWVDYVIRPGDLGNLIPAGGDVLEDPKYAREVAGFLRADAIVGLHHCFTGNTYKDKNGKTDAPCLAARLCRIWARESTVFGYKHYCAFPYLWRNKNGDDEPQDDEVRAWPPEPDYRAHQESDVVWFGSQSGGG